MLQNEVTIVFRKYFPILALVLCLVGVRDVLAHSEPACGDYHQSSWHYDPNEVIPDGGTATRLTNHDPSHGTGFELCRKQNPLRLRSPRGPNVSQDTLAAANGALSASVIVSGGEPGETVTFTLSGSGVTDSSPKNTATLPTTRSDTVSAVRLNFRFPVNAAPGTYRVNVVATEGPDTAYTSFNVRVRAPTQGTNIYYQPYENNRVVLEGTCEGAARNDDGTCMNGPMDAQVACFAPRGSGTLGLTATIISGDSGAVGIEARQAGGLQCVYAWAKTDADQQNDSVRVRAVATLGSETLTKPRFNGFDPIFVRFGPTYPRNPLIYRDAVS